MSITTRLAKGAPLTFAEMDANFTTLAGIINAGFNYGLDTGTVNVLVLTLTSPPAAYFDGMNFSLKVANTTTSAATLNVNGFGAKNIYDEFGTILTAGVLVAGQIYTFVYNSSLNSSIGGFTAFIPNALNVPYIPIGTGVVATTVGAKLNQFVSVVDFGADPTGIADSTTAISNATKSNTFVFWPKGTYKVTNLVLTNISNCMWVAEAAGGVGITTTTTGIMITWNGGGFNVIDGFIFSPTGVLAASTGMLFQTAHNNSAIRNCVFQLWTKIGLQHLGTVGTPLSGNKIYDSYFLQNANASGFGQVDMSYNNDFFIQNNQMGIINTVTYGFPSYGVRADHTSNGSYISNFAWQNLQGGQFSTCAYDRLLSNRFEQSQHEGAIFNACTALMLQNNWFNNNGIATLNTYNQLRIQATVNGMIQGNQFYDWSGGVNNAKYAMSFETACTRLSIKNNVADKYGTAATFFDSTMPSTQNTTDGSLNYSSGNTVAAATTTFLGQGTVSSGAFVVNQYLSTTHTVVQLIIETTAAPGAGQTYTYTVYKNSVATGLTLQTTGTGTFQAVSNATTVIEDTANNAAYTVQLVTSAAAAVAAHYAQIVFVAR